MRYAGTWPLKLRNSRKIRSLLYFKPPYLKEFIKTEFVNLSLVLKNHFQSSCHFNENCD